MKVFITGTSGFIGKWLAEKCIDEGIEICGFDIVPCPFVNLAKYCTVGDILDLDQIMSAVNDCQPDFLIHLAARVDLFGDTILDYDANITGVSNVISAVRSCESIQRVIFTSSQLVCQVGTIPESDNEYNADTLYGQSKVISERLVRSADGGGVSWAITRPTTVWGPHMSPHYQKLLKFIRKGFYFHPGTGELDKSYAYAGNIAHQYYMLMLAKSSEVNRKTFYLADYKPLSLRKYIDNLSKEMGVRSPIELPLPVAKILASAGDLVNYLGVSFPFDSFRLKNIRTEYVFDLSATESVCGPLPYGHEEGIKATASWFIREG